MKVVKHCKMGGGKIREVERFRGLEKFKRFKRLCATVGVINNRVFCHLPSSFRRGAGGEVLPHFALPANP